MDMCDFVVSNNVPQVPIMPTVAVTPPIEGPTTICSGTTAVFSIPEVGFAGFYTWHSSNQAVKFNNAPSPVDLQAPSGRTVNVTVPSGLPDGATFIVCVTPTNSCATGLMRCKTITVQSLPVTHLPKAAVCHEDAPFILPWGDSLSVTGTVEHTYITANGCDSSVQQMVQILPPKTTLITRYICNGANIDVCGNIYGTQGQYVTHCTSYQGCDSTVTLTLNVVAPIAKILAPDTLLVCGASSLILASQTSPNFPGVSIKTWKNVATGTTTPGESFLVNQSGQYILTTKMSAGGVQCSVADTVYVVFYPLETPLNAFATVSNTITCISPTAMLSGGALGSATSFSWTGPQNFEADTNMITVNTPGIYSFLAGNNNCNDVFNIAVSKNIQTGSLNITASAVGCDQPAEILSNPTLQGLVFQWITPLGDTFFSQNITGNFPGSYTVVAMNPENGCSVSDSVVVVSDTTLPLVEASVTNTINGQSTGAINLHIWGGTPPFTYTWIFNGNIIANTEDLTNLGAGTYNVTVKGGNGCDTTLTLKVLEITVLTQELSSATFWKIAPNPASRFIHIQWAGNTPAPESGISCFKVTGELMNTSHLEEGHSHMVIDCANFPQGVYLLEIVPSGNDQRVVTRFEIVR